SVGNVGGGGPVIINGTNGNDIITIIARDASYSPLANGVQDFTVSVNSGPDVLFVDTPTVTVNALNGDDKVVVQTPAPNNAAWNVTVNVDGGTPQASDTLVVEKPNTGAETVAYTPSGFNSGQLTMTNVSGPVATINIADIENLTYEGLNNLDAL